MCLTYPGSINFTEQILTLITLSHFYRPRIMHSYNNMSKHFAGTIKLQSKCKLITLCFVYSRHFAKGTFLCMVKIRIMSNVMVITHNMFKLTLKYVIHLL